MIIEDINYLEVVVESAQVNGGILNFNSLQFNISEITQSAEALAGNGSLIGAGNVAAAVNTAAPVQANL